MREHIRLEVNSTKEKKYIISAAVLSAILVILDQVTKVAVINSFQLHESKNIIPELFNLCYVRNNGAAWNIFAGQKFFLLSVSVIAFFATIYYFRTLCEGWKERYIAIGMIISGIIGNGFDRFWYGFVIDFLDFYIGTTHWPAFNVADMAICGGVGLYLISSFYRPELKKEVISNQ